jgi:hypothetical protein
MTASTTVAPDSKLYRTVSDAVDVVTAAADTFLADVKNGLNCGHFNKLNIEIIPDPDNAGANPVVQVYFWSETAGRFLEVSPTPLAIAAQGANVPHTFTIDCLGRILAIAVTGGIGAGEKVFIATSGYEIDHTL